MLVFMTIHHLMCSRMIALLEERAKLDVLIDRLIK
jgi:hypothetical protein